MSQNFDPIPSEMNNQMTEEEKKRVGKVTKKVNDMLDARSPQLIRWEDNIARQQFEKNATEVARRKRLGMSSLRIPMEFAFVESKTSDEIDTLPFAKVLPVEINDNADAELFQQMFDYVLNDRLNLKEIMIRAYLKQKNTLGDAILKTYWLKEERTVRKPIKKLKNGTIKYEESKVTTYDDIKIDLIDVRNFAIDPIVYEAGKTLEDANYCVFFSIYEYDAFEELFEDREGYKNIEMVQPQTSYINNAIKSSPESVSDIIEKKVEVVEYWDILKDRLVFLANGIEIRETAIPYMNPFSKKKKLPIAHFIDHISATGFFNIGEIDLVKDLSEERETQRNINLDAAKSYPHPFLLFGGMNDFDVDEAVFGPNNIGYIEDVNQFKQVNMAGNSGLPFNLEGANQNDSVIATGHDVSGVLGASGETATKTLEKKESQIKRTRFGNTYNEVNGFKRLYGLVKDLILQFYTKDQFKHIVGEGGEVLYDKLKENTKMLKQDYNMTVITNNQIPASKEIQKLRNQELLATLGALPFDPATGALPPHLVEPVRKALYDLGVDKEMADKTVEGQGQQQGQGEDLQRALQGAAEAGVQIEGMEGVGFERQQGTPANSQQPGVQQSVQGRIQGAIG